ncbi:hypothetical protein O181_112216 [Austropuccinia psidii MF-1]|uniref:Uncharacterized protein n=1 Tax=Austropuccinia psidii MF-1 TaxID=1389203 RepID=A0A9Q3K2L8_9BASI|nr:hypothetical protein [Austropuccinia psidii MF-1]
MSIDSSTQQDHNELPLRKDLNLDLLQINQLQTLAEMDQLDTLLEPRSPDPLPSPSKNLDYPVMVEVDYCFSQLPLSEVNELLSPSREEETLITITSYKNDAKATGSQNLLKSLQEIVAFDMSLSVQPFIKTENHGQLIKGTSIRSMDPELSHHNWLCSSLDSSASDSMQDSVKKEDHLLSSLSFSIVDQIEGESTMIYSEGLTSHFFK